MFVGRLLALAIRAALVWALFILLESGQGALRRLLFGTDVPTIVRQLSVGSGVLVSFLLAWVCGRWMRLRSQSEALAVGALWAILTLLFEAVVGTLSGASWATAADYDPRRGGLMAFGMVAVAFAPWLAYRLRRRRGRLIHLNAQGLPPGSNPSADRPSPGPVTRRIR